MAAAQKNRAPVNPGYLARTSAQDFRSEISPGPTLRCPKCKKLIIEATIERLYKKCRGCGQWVYMEKIVDK